MFSCLLFFLFGSVVPFLGSWGYHGLFAWSFICDIEGWFSEIYICIPIDRFSMRHEIMRVMS
ncbi:hypothetical protein M440DRAFT_264682 [Trichoderma longibrachiatum ATCC 18648]|uniref:Uncharacterized protein n=1 Tax=Trichoderma longibrachiatum ATCC 18648 TaxID=983965 RepID=A0A2T4CAG1_TRILO|nr:hypothetical protein M440DRAFT_264682 [Trichoderma longibrachiatum ATCC 18648]